MIVSSAPDQQRPLLVIFDTNIWKANHFLRSPSAAAVRALLRLKRAKVALPEVIRLEVERHLRRQLKKLRQEIEEKHKSLLTLAARLKELVLPSDADIEKIVAGAFDGLGVQLKHIEFSVESARSSFLKVVDYAPPNTEHSQQFKDGVIWADCVALLAENDVTLVTADKGFRDGETLHPELQKEIAAKPGTFRLFSDLGSLLKEIQAKIEIPSTVLHRAVLSQVGHGVTGLAERQGYHASDEATTTYRVFATEDAERFFVEFTLSIVCVDATDSDRSDAKLIIDGEGLYLPDTSSLQEVRSTGERFEMTQEDGSTRELKNVIIFAGGITIGHRLVTHSIRYPMDVE
jgi:hypothetical protein